MEDRRIISRNIEKQDTFKQFFNVAMTVAIILAVLISLAIFFWQRSEEIARHNRELSRNMTLLSFICSDMKNEDDKRWTLYLAERNLIISSHREHWNWHLLSNYYVERGLNATNRQHECAELAKEPK